MAQGFVILKTAIAQRANAPSAITLAAVVHLELDRVRREFEADRLFHLQLNVSLDLVTGEHATFQQEVVVSQQAVTSFTQAAANL